MWYYLLELSTVADHDFPSAVTICTLVAGNNRGMEVDRVYGMVP